MRRRSINGTVGVLVVVGLAACGPGRLPDPGFGTAAEAETASTDDPTGDPSGTPSAEDDDGPSSESLGDDDPGDGDGEASSSSTTTEGESSSSATTEDDDPSADEADDWADEGMDTWGEPPDVTNEPCEPLTQDCFPTHKCVPFATLPGSSFLDANKCMPILGDKQWGEPCTLSNFNEAQDDCDGEGFCWNLQWVQGELHGTCVPFCTGTPQHLMCPLGWGCMFGGAISLCSMQCDPLLQDCPNFYGCYWGGNHFQCRLSATPAAAGQSCELVHECVPGLACVEKALVPGCVGNDEGCCTPWCNLEAPDCEGGLECVAFLDPDSAPWFLADVGICIAD